MVSQQCPSSWCWSRSGGSLMLPSPREPGWDLLLLLMPCLAEADPVHCMWSWSHRCICVTLSLLPQPCSSTGLWGGCMAAGASTSMGSPHPCFFKASPCPTSHIHHVPREQQLRSIFLWGDEVPSNLFLPLLLTQQNWCWSHSYFINALTASKTVAPRGSLCRLPCLYTHRTSLARYFLEHMDT